MHPQRALPLPPLPSLSNTRRPPPLPVTQPTPTHTPHSQTVVKDAVKEVKGVAKDAAKDTKKAIDSAANQVRAPPCFLGGRRGLLVTLMRPASTLSKG